MTPARRGCWVFLLVLLACREGVDEDSRASADLYIEGFCAEFDDRAQECEAEGYTRPSEWTFEDCVSDRTQDVEEDPCFIEETEIFRCFAERLTCEEWTADSISVLPGTPCAETNADWLQCADANDLGTE